MIYCFDIDNTICETEQNFYSESKPYQEVIDGINNLYIDGHRILFFTARGSVSGIDWTDLTKKQLKTWGVKYHELIMNKKPHFDLLVDDKCVNIEEWKKEKIPRKTGFIAGCFDMIHPGYIKMWRDAKRVCNHLIIGLQTDPTIDRSFKNKPIHSVEERLTILKAIKYIDEIVIYETEEDLYELLKNLDIDIRILGSDYENVEYNGHDLEIPVYFHQRDHDWSATNLKNKIKNRRLNK